MISHLTGSILFSDMNFVVLDVAGVGYKVFISPETMRSVDMQKNTEIALWTHQVVRENSLDLYGFLDRSELNFFELLITISGIGPKSALGILSVATLETLRKAISSGDTSYLTKVSGIGKKNAEKIVLELRDKLGALEFETNSEALREESDALDALCALGYSQNEARETLKQLSPEITSTGAKVKEALRVLGQHM